jgi:hypothetical protein
MGAELEQSAALAAWLHRYLGPLAADAGWALAPAAEQPHGHYTDPIADALTPFGVASVEALAVEVTVAERALLRDRALLGCLERLELHYALLVDTGTGQGYSGVTQRLGQVQQALVRVRQRMAQNLAAATTAALVAPTPRRAVGVVVRGRRRRDYTLESGDQVREEQ